MSNRQPWPEAEAGPQGCGRDHPGLLPALRILLGRTKVLVGYCRVSTSRQGRSGLGRSR